ncbi:uncharacterized protein J4E88_005564 [Alternaria novae-zelandiae]|uniref:uncharacterized protein n=1 Tax=Alternaria novae-zelandiae TaxID=430562 RepID=UPI0020C592AE|nr:uncharacterized protein J4E88_005564 [Alternaria novae-zelandiae]KAI4681059.1 hypothetical protein J4E88_005564 [Alternaria novae-zelandiae]
MPVSISPAQPKDAVDIAALHVQAFSSNALMRAIYPTPAIWAALQGCVEEKILADMKEPKITVLVAKHTDEAEVREEQGKTVGYAVWCHPIKAEEQDWKLPTWKLPEGTDWNVLKPWLAAAGKIVEEVIGHTPHYDLMWLAVSPDYSRMGIGTLLLRWGMDLCEKEGVSVYLDSTLEAAQTFYQKAGFIERGRIRLVVNEEMYEEVAFVYEPKR